MSINDYLSRPYNIIINKVSDESGQYYYASVLEFDGCHSSGDTEEAAFAGIREAMKGWVETKLANGFEVPAPVAPEEYSGKFNLRIPSSLHMSLAMEAKLEGVSLNQYLVYKLSK
jgi:predicted RNase H-like HicB family nuclease